MGNGAARHDRFCIQDEERDLFRVPLGRGTAAVVPLRCPEIRVSPANSRQVDAGGTLADSGAVDLLLIL